MRAQKSMLKASIQIEQKLDHPNKAPFEGTLLYVDKPSENAPGGTGGKKLLVPRDVAENSLPSLIGMGVNCSYWMDDHDETNKIGVIEEAWIEDDGAVKVKGYFFAKDFKDQVDEIREYQGSIGMSMETTETILEDVDWNGETVAKAVSIVFTGAAILYKWSAAYRNTSIAANTEKEGSEMDMKQILDAIASMKTDITATVDDKLSKFKEDIKKETEITAGAAINADDFKKVVESVEALTKSVEEIKAGNQEQKPTPPQRRSMTSLSAKYDVKVQEGEDIFAAIDKKELNTTESMAAKLSILNS